MGTKLETVSTPAAATPDNVPPADLPLPGVDDAPVSPAPVSPVEPSPAEATPEATPHAPEEDKAEADSTGEAEPATEEKPAEPEATPKESAILRALRKREARNVEREKAHARQVAEFNNFTAKVKPQIDAFNAREKLAKEDPLKYLHEVHGFSIEDLGRRILNDGKPSLEEQSKKERSAHEERLARLEKENADLKASQEAARIHAQNQAARDSFTALATKGDSFPLAAKREALSPGWLADEGDRIAELAFERTKARTGVGQRFTHQEILAYIEKDLRATASLLAESAAQTAPKSTTEKTGQKGQQATQIAPTLTGKGAAQRASMPKDVLSLTPEQERAMTLAAVEKAKKERAA